MVLLNFLRVEINLKLLMQTKKKIMFFAGLILVIVDI